MKNRISETVRSVMTTSRGSGHGQQPRGGAVTCIVFISMLIFSGVTTARSTSDPGERMSGSDSLFSGSQSFAIDNLPKGALGTVTLSFKDTDLRDIFRAISHQHGLNIVVENSINRRASIALRNVRVYDALRYLCEHNALSLTLEGGIFRVGLPPSPPPKIPLVAFQNGHLSVSLKNDDLESVILEVQNKSGKNILLAAGTTGSVSGNLMEIEFDAGFTQLMNNNGFAVQKRNGIYLVSRLDYFTGTQGTTASHRSGPYWVSVRDSLVTIDVTSASLERVLTDMIRQLNTDLVVYNQLSGTVTVRATNVPLNKAMDMLLRNTQFGYRESDGIYFVGEKSNKALISTRLLAMKYLRAEQILDLIPQAIVSQATIKVMKEHNGFVIIAPSDVVEQMREFISQIDRPVAQVLLEAIVVDYDLTRASEFGIRAGLLGKSDTTFVSRKGTYLPGFDVVWGGKDLNTYLTKAGRATIFGHTIDLASVGRLPGDFYLGLKAMERDGLANVRSRPIIATLNGHKATLSIGTTQYFLLKTTIPYRDQNQTLFQESQTFHTIEADVRLEITPFVGSDGQITLDIKPDFKTPVGQLSPEIPPTINSRSLSSTVVVRDGETIVLGGLVQELESEVKTKVPILGSIPLLGMLFSSTEKMNRKAELLIYVTPRVSYGEPFQAYRSNEESDD